MSELPPYHVAAGVALAAASSLSPSLNVQQLIAYIALRELYPTASMVSLGLVVHYPAPNFAEAMAKLHLFADVITAVEVDHVIGTIVAPLYGERAN
ncbi:hypothetical protein [Agrobacterium salinitolerans]|uniref:hypothetical protein n=1 Tax=Agrobacterium salinitolerans TaxID=1183413 RepID=UPI001573882D|nr:hypothetical protein [Agrobacterium salinitolerans]NTA36700.1 hypothetical protein [Agrobacterium salinitolerans]NTA36762.1 hypothetical protein [Agrobacterium salinitolerans]